MWLSRLAKSPIAGQNLAGHPNREKPFEPTQEWSIKSTKVPY
jgi:hypothetical protein